MIEEKIKKYNINDIERFLTGNNLIDGYNSNLVKFIKKYYNDNNLENKNEKLFLGRINDDLAVQINELLNNSEFIQERINKKYNVKNTNIVISSNNIRHIYKRHGKEKNKRQLNVTPEKLAKYKIVISNPDYIGISKQLSRSNTPIIYFTKKINGYSIAIEVLSGKKQLYPESYYIFRSNSKEYINFIKKNKLKKAENVISDDYIVQ